MDIITILMMKHFTNFFTVDNKCNIYEIINMPNGQQFKTTNFFIGNVTEKTLYHTYYHIYQTKEINIIIHLKNILSAV